MVKSGVKEFPFISVARQGYRTAVEILANAAIMEGKQVYLGSHISGARSMAPHSITLRIANTTSIPTGVYATSPTGLFASSETLVTWTKSEFGTIGETGIVEAIGAFQKGLLMVCTNLPPEQIKYPLDFEGTIATADAAEIFRSKVAIDPPPYGIASLGLFLKATDDLIGLDTVKKCVMGYDRLNKKVRELNVNLIEEVYKNTKVKKDMKIKGGYTPVEWNSVEEKKPMKLVFLNEGAAGGNPSYAWREKLPVCNQSKCVCIECVAAYYCPEAAIAWKDEVFTMDYNYCKGCGTCAKECPEHAITMEEADKVLASLKK